MPDAETRGPLLALERAMHGGLAPGELGVVGAPAGVGKTAFLVQLGIDGLLRGQRVLHVAFDTTVDRVHGWYDEMFPIALRQSPAEDAAAARFRAERGRMIQVYPARGWTVDRLARAMDMLGESMGFQPDLLIADGLDLLPQSREALVALRAFGLDRGLRTWCATCPSQDPTDADVVVELRPQAGRLDLEIIALRGAPATMGSILRLEPETFALSEVPVSTIEFDAPIRDRGEYTLYSGAAAGSEAAFGEIAERYGIREVNFTFAGHSPARERGLVELGETELRRGDVSLAYVSRRMNRSYTSSPSFRRVLQSIWHMVDNAEQVLVIGAIQEDRTVRGGTGWGAELARLSNKPLWVYDQEKRSWFRWSGSEQRWVKASVPKITHSSFSGTGTRFLTEDGHAAIEAVFEATFSPS